MKSEDTRNLFLAIALSVLVMAAWQYFYAGPLYQREHQSQTQANTAAPASGAAPSAAPGAPGASIPGAASPPGGPAPSVAGTVAEVLAASPRVTIDTPSIGGSIDLKGGKFDDIILKDYRETIDPKSPNIRLFSPPGAPDAYWAETGFVSADARQDPQSRHRLDRRPPDADRRAAGDADLGQRRGPCRSSASSRSTTNTCSRSPTRSSIRAPRQRRCSPLASFCGTAGRTSPDIRCCTRGSWASSPAATRRRWPSRCRFKKSPTPRSKRTPGGCAPSRATAAGSASPTSTGAPRLFPTRPPRSRRGFQPTEPCSRWTTRPISWARRKPSRRELRSRRRPVSSLARKRSARSTIIETNLGIKKFSLMIDWGWFWMITHADVPASGCDLQGRRQFRRRNSHRHRSRQARLLPARQPVLPVDGEDEEDPAEDRGAEGTLSGRSRQAAAGADGAVQARGRQSGRRLPADGDPDPGILRPLQGHLHHHRDAARAVFRLDQGSLVAGSDQRLHPLRARPMGPDRLAGNRPFSRSLESGR